MTKKEKILLEIEVITCETYIIDCVEKLGCLKGVGILTDTQIDEMQNALKDLINTLEKVRREELLVDETNKLEENTSGGDNDRS